MNFTAEENDFLRGLVKASRQKTRIVAWIDRDGSSRSTSLAAEEATQLLRLAQRAGMSPSELMRQAAHIPLKKPA